MSETHTWSDETDPDAVHAPDESAEAPSGPIAELARLAAPVLDAAPRSTFFHIVALLERLSAHATRIGGDGPPRNEAIRFRHDMDLGFSSGDIKSLEVAALPTTAEQSLEEPRPYFRVTTTFLGLTGTVSPLPLYMAEEILHEDDSNPVRRDFLDVFHHRTISLLYRAVSKFMPAREHLTHRTDPWMTRALYVSGLDPMIQGRGLRVHPSVLVRLAPLLAGRGRGARLLRLALRETLRDALAPDGEVQVREFVGGWIDVDEGQRMALGRRNNVLGVEAILGKRTYDQSGRFAVRIGPLHNHNYTRFLADGDLLPQIREVVRLCVREPLSFDVELVLAPDAVPAFTLSSVTPAALLGRDTRLRGSTPQAEVLVLRDVGRMQLATGDTHH